MQTFLIWGALAALAAALGTLTGRSKSTKTYVVVGILSFLVAGITGWALNPTLNLAFSYIWYQTIIAFAFGFAASRSRDAEYGDYFDPFRAGGSGALVAVLMLVVFWLIGFVTTDSFFHARSYHELLGQPKVVTTFGSDVAPVDTTKLRVVNSRFARQIADKMLGEQQGLGSQVELGSMHIAQLNGCMNVHPVGARQDERLCFEHELVWVAPVTHSGFFRWLSNGSTHQYVMVSASDPTRKYFIDRVDGKPITLRYHYTGAHFHHDLVRHLREHGYLTRGITDFNFELDDAGHPWWVAVTYDKKVGFSGEDPTGVVVVDPATGAIREYGIDNVPAWVDRVQPEGMTLRQFDKWGKYGRGWLNSWTSRQGTVQTSTHDLHLVEGTDGRTYWYTGVTSYGRDQSTTGFVLIDTKTKEVRMYRVPGATEEAAQASAMNAPGVREKRYGAGEPILYNMEGHPTYFMTLSGDDGLPRMYAFVSVRNYELVGVGENIPAALRQYEARLRGAGRTGLGQTATAPETVEGSVLRIVREGDSFALILSGESGAEYYAPGNLSPEVKYTQVGDTVRMTYQRSPGRVDRVVLVFDNTGLALVAAPRS